MEREKVLSFIGRAYATACSHGFHDVDRSDAHFMMLVISEIGEMVEADRKNRRANHEGFEKCVGLTYDDRFKDYIKDTLEDELADVCIRLFDFCGLRRLVPSVVDMKEEFDRLFGGLSVSEQCFALSSFVTNTVHEPEMANRIGMSLAFCVEFARHHGIDLVWHIERKMEYNETRPMKHGKKY
jgi:NTP pyrophosphatase (non-canonical NTP hydrolase)